MAILLCCSLWVSCSRDTEELYNKIWEYPDTIKNNPDTGTVNNPTNPVDDMVVYMLPEPQSIQLSAEQKDFVAGNNTFTLNFLKAVNEAEHSGRSFVYSPLNITYMLAMVNDAAEGQTRQELEQTLGFHQGGIEAVNQYCKTLIRMLPYVDQNVRLNIANGIFVNKGFTLKSQFQQDMQQYYGAAAEAIDFSLPTALGRINKWCEEQTRGTISTILDELDPDATSYLLNAVYFQGGWTSKFDEKQTKKENFATPEGNVQLPLMHQYVLIRYMKNDTYSAVEIPYGGGLWSMIMMLPQEGYTTDDIINRLAGHGSLEGNSRDYPTMGDFVYQRHEVDLKLPRFETTSDTEELQGGLIELLKPIGIRQVFDSQLSNVPNMCEKSNFYVNMMRQKTAIEMREKGADASAFGMGYNGDEYGNILLDVGGTDPKATFHANRPFVYVIRELSTGVILFVGKFTGM